MNLVRQKCAGTWLALIAMALQIAFTFGHIHGAQHHVDGSLQLAVSSVFKQVSHQHNDNPDEQRQENCPTCWTLGISSSLVLPGDVITPWPNGNLASLWFITNTPLISASRILPYHVRAPPSAPVV